MVIYTTGKDIHNQQGVYRLKVVIDTVNQKGVHEILHIPVTDAEVELMKRATPEERKDFVRTLVWKYSLQ